MDDLGVELDSVEVARRHVHGAEFRVAARAEDFESPLRHFRDLVAVGHPHLNARRKPHEELPGFDDVEDRLAVFACFSAGDLSPEGLDHELQPVADPENRDSKFKDGRVALRRIRGIDARGAAREDDSFRILRPDRRRRRMVRHDFAVDPAFADPAGDQLTVLRTEIENDDRFTHRRDFPCW